MAVKDGAQPRPNYYNAAFLVKPDGMIGAVYRKMHLVPFGEYVPLKRLLFFVDAITGFPDFTPGGEGVLLPVGDHLASTAICYEVIYGNAIRDAVAPRQRAADDDHQRRVVRTIVGGVSALGAGLDAGDRERPLPGARRQHRHQRLRRPLWPGARPLWPVRAAHAGSRGALPERRARSTPTSAISSPGCRWRSSAPRCWPHARPPRGADALQYSRTPMALQLDEQLRRHEDLARRANDLRSYL